MRREVGLLPSDVERLSEWIRAQVAEAGRVAAVVGLSGGIDSATVAALAKRALGDEVYGVIMPCESDPADAEDARLAAEALNVSYRVVDLGPVFQVLRAQLELPPNLPRLAVANLKPRLRMITLYAEAAARNALVLGTGNRSELEIGYFTKYGDGGVDLLPLGGLVKTEVRALAADLGVPRPILDKRSNPHPLSKKFIGRPIIGGVSCPRPIKMAKNAIIDAKYPHNAHYSQLVSVPSGASLNIAPSPPFATP
jgi:NAD+ synthase